MKTGLTLGKFAPFHAGHEYLIEYALRYVDQLYVMVYASDELPEVSLETKIGWVKSRFPEIIVIPAPDGPKQTGYTDEIKRLQENYILETLNDIEIDIFFSSELYSEHVSNALGARGVMVDINRKNVPISATQIRQNPKKYRSFLSESIFKELIHQ